MPDQLIPISPPPGLYKNGTLYQSKNRWYDANLIRFWQGAIEPVGGWARAQDANGNELVPLTGIPRAAQAWRSNTGDQYLAFGTTKKLQLLLAGALYDLTPAGFTAGRVDSGELAGGGAYGYGQYGVGVYGVGSTSLAYVDADTWQLDVFGQYLAGVSTSDKKLYVWQCNVNTPAAVAANSPAQVGAVVVTPERFLVALGATDPATGAYDPRRVQWASQETIDSWNPLNTTAGSFPLSTNGRLRCGRRGKGETLLWTDTDLWAMRYIGGLFVYSFAQVGDHCGSIGPNAVAVADGRAFWMGQDAFYSYDGFVQPIPSEVADYVYGNLNRAQQVKVAAVPMAEFGEIWWFYPCLDQTEPHCYVVYNYRENHWMTGTLPRTAGAPAGAFDNPYLAGFDGAIYKHEILEARTSNNPSGFFYADGTHNADGLYRGDGATGYLEYVPFLESGPIEIGDGTELMSVQRFVPDVLAFGDVQLTLFGAMEPANVETTYGPYPLNVATPLRFVARQIRVRFDQVNETGWRIGTLRLGVMPVGRR